MSEPERHVAQSAEADHANLFPGADSPFSQRRVSRDARAQKRRRGRRIEFIGKSKDEILIDHDALRIAAVCDPAGVRIFAVIGKSRAAFAELLEARAAVCTHSIGIDQTSDCGQLAFLKFPYPASDLDDASDDFMAGHARKNGATHSLRAMWRSE